MLISVIITTYNSPDFLQRCINSFLDQADSHFEIIVADDGSKEETKLLIKKYKDSHLNIKHAWHEDKGFRAAKIRNEAVKKANGDFIAFLDVDDWWENIK